MREKFRRHPVLYMAFSIVSAAFFWYLIFVRRPFNFWLMMASATLLLSGLALWYDGEMIRRDEFNRKNIVIGIVSGIVLYFVFMAGQGILLLLAELLPGLFSGSSDFISSVYANKKDLPAWAVGIILFFPIGFGEEIFWRGLIQKQLALQIHNGWALLLATFFYTAVHLPTQNPVLLLAAALCGLYWGGIYLKTGSMVPVIISHMVWDPLIFVIFPLM